MSEINTLVECRERAVELLMSAERITVLRTLPGGVRAWILETARVAWQREGLRVLGATANAETARDLENWTGIRSFPLRMLLEKLVAGTIALDDETVVVLIANSVRYDLCAQLRPFVERSRARLVRVEDAHVYL